LTAPKAFDLQHYELLNRARGDVVTRLLAELQPALNLRTAIDVGCGFGHFSGLLRSLGFDVTAIDGRAENAAQARRRYPDVNFIVANAEDLLSLELPCFDLVLCFGLLYHLENPFRVIRNLHALTQKILLVEGICVPGEKPFMELLDECAIEDQGLNFVAFYPSEACLVKMLYRSGFPFVYLFKRLPEHPVYRQSVTRKRERTLLLASKVALTAPGLVPAQEALRAATGPANPWDTALGRPSSLRSFVDLLRVRIPRFLRRPWPEKREIISWYTKRARSRN
jgi:SAM-dependent methyltransferase